MGDITEILLTCHENEKQISISACDLRTYTNLMNYKSAFSVYPRTFCFLDSQHMIGASISKPLLNVWRINAPELLSSVRYITPGRVNALDVSPDGCYLVGAVQEVFYVWHLNSGRLMNAISKHYQSINCIRFDKEGSIFVTAGKDGNVLVWNLTQVVLSGDENSTPIYSLNDHGLSVTDIHIGQGGLSAFLYTASLDRTCKIYDLSDGELLLSVVFNESLHCVIADSMETCVFVGTNVGNIHKFCVDTLPRVKEYHMEDAKKFVFSGHKNGTTVTCLDLSVSGNILVSGGQDQQVCIWDIISHQLIKSIPYKGPITNIKLRTVLYDELNPEHKQKVLFAKKLNLMIDSQEADDSDTVSIFVTKKDDSLSKAVADKPENIKMFYNKSSSKGADEKENEELLAIICNLKHVNKELFKESIKVIFDK